MSYEFNLDDPEDVLRFRSFIQKHYIDSGYSLEISTELSTADLNRILSTARGMN